MQCFPCRRWADGPRRLSCGHGLCWECAGEAVSSEALPTCPVCERSMRPVGPALLSRNQGGGEESFPSLQRILPKAKMQGDGQGEKSHRSRRVLKLSDGSVLSCCFDKAKQRYILLREDKPILSSEMEITLLSVEDDDGSGLGKLRSSAILTFGTKKGVFVGRLNGHRLHLVRRIPKQ